MRKIWLFCLGAVLVLTVWGADWPMPGGSPQRNSWAGSERHLTRTNVNSLKLLYKYQSDNQSSGLAGLTTPIISGNLITYVGFKEMLMFTGSSDKVFSVDADLNKLIWENQLLSSAEKPTGKSPTAACPGGMTAPMVMAGSSSSSLHFAAIARRTPAGASIRSARPSPYLPSLAQSIYPMQPTTLTQLNAIYTVSSDGYLHVINSSTGQDLIGSVRFVPPGAKVTSLNLHDNVVYATTGSNCDGYQNALFAIDLLSTAKPVSSFLVPYGEFAGSDGTAIGNDGTVYVEAPFSPAGDGKRYYDAVVALTPKELKVKDYFLLSNKSIKLAKSESPGITPGVFSFPSRDLIIAGSRDGRLLLLDSRSLGGADHRTPLFATTALASRSKNYDGNGFRGAFSTWLDVDTGMRRFYVPIYGRSQYASGSKADGQENANGTLAAFELSGTADQPTLKATWTSGDLLSPAPAVIANGMVFVLSTGESPRTAKKDGTPYSISEREQLAQPASLSVFDAVTGQQLFATGSVGVGAIRSAGLALANGRAYFSARDNAVYCFGIPAQQSQLIEQ